MDGAAAFCVSSETMFGFLYINIARERRWGWLAADYVRKEPPNTYFLGFKSGIFKPTKNVIFSLIGYPRLALCEWVRCGMQWGQGCEVRWIMEWKSNHKRDTEHMCECWVCMFHFKICLFALVKESVSRMWATGSAWWILLISFLCAMRCRSLESLKGRGRDVRN